MRLISNRTFQNIHENAEIRAKRIIGSEEEREENRKRNQIRFETISSAVIESVIHSVIFS